MCQVKDYQQWIANITKKNSLLEVIRDGTLPSNHLKNDLIKPEFQTRRFNFMNLS